MFYPVILAGGSGTRLWPASTKKTPKQLQALLDNKSLLQNTYDRLLQGFEADNIFIETGIHLSEDVAKQLNIKPKNIIAEPVIKNTAFAIGFAALKLLTLDKEAIIATINSDHYIEDVDKYLDSIKAGADVVAKHSDKMLLLGTKPQIPDIACGYMKMGQMTADKGVYQIDAFKEKPDLATAKKYVADGNYLLNPAIFIFSASQLLRWYQEYLPDMYKALMDIQQTSQADYTSFEAISIDYGLLEKLEGMLVMPAEFGWIDVGNWRSLRDIQSKGKGHVANTKHVTIDSNHNLFFSDTNKMIATIGVKDMILVEANDVIFLCPADRAQEVKDLIAKMKGTDLDKYL